MARVILGMTMSLDGYINDREGSVAALYPDLATLRDTELMQDVIGQTGAVVMGRNAFAMAEDPDSFADNYEFQVPIFVLTHRPPKRMPRQSGNLTFIFCTDGVECAIDQARETARDKDVMIIGGASTARQCLEARVVDELHLTIMPILLGGGTRLFEHMPAEEMQLEKLRTIEFGSGGTYLEYRVVKNDIRPEDVLQAISQQLK